MLKKIKQNWSRLADELAGKKIFWFKSPSGILLLDSIDKTLKEHCRGMVIDVGAGRLAYKGLIEKYCDEYKSIDFKATNPSLDFIGDAQDMAVLQNKQFDTVFCSQVLEHVPEPQRAVDEMSRVVKSGGKVIISVPFLGYLHNEPYDFFRFTKHSLKYMAKKSRLKMVETKEVGGFFSFLGYIWSTIFVGLFAGIPVVKYLAFAINIPIAYIFIFLDILTMNKKIMPLNYIIILQKEDE